MTAPRPVEPVWRESWRTDPAVRPVADRHYNRQHIGAQNFVPPGRCLVLSACHGVAFWVTSWPFAEYVRHAWAGAWVCSAFRRESGPWLASDMIRAAVAATRAKWPMTPDLGMITFVDERHVRRKRDAGRCYLKAGFKRVGETKGGLVALQLMPSDMPPAFAALPINESLFSGGTP